MLLAVLPLAAAALPPPAAPPAIRLGARLTLGPEHWAGWCWSGAFRHPVGDPFELGAPGPDGEPGFRVNRNVGEAGGHQGADLDNRRGGDPVRAAAHGLVIVADGTSWNGGYGGLVVIAHRLPDETLVYSVSAHLMSASLRVRAGDPVRGGEVLGRIGRSGRATTEHLHFEIRRPRDPAAPWELADVVDPIAFLAAHRPAAVDSGWRGPYLAWARDAALVPPWADPDQAMDHARWWSILARATRHGLVRLPDDPAGLRPALIAERLLAADASRGAVVEWADLDRDLERARVAGLRLPPLAVDASLHREVRRRELEGGARSAEPPTLLQACVALADLAGVAEGARRGAR